LAKQQWQVNSVSVRVQPTAPKGEIGRQAVGKSVHLSTQNLAALSKLYTSMCDSPARKALAALLEHHRARPPRDPAPKAPADAPRTSAAESARRRKARP
jgi:cytochrome c556